MMYPVSEKAEIIARVEQLRLPAKRMLGKLGLPRATFYRWDDCNREGWRRSLGRSPLKDISSLEY